MALFKTIFIIWIFWWIIKKVLTYLGNQANPNRQPNFDNHRKEEFKQRNMDVQDAEFEEIDESS
ncbi:MAG: hypothetical protein H8E60_03735 [Candidatus Marinimicrobia bacterium]|nr:hypothetical protein [Candidatus Neomarinimicrobiota bacterium]